MRTINAYCSGSIMPGTELDLGFKGNQPWSSFFGEGYKGQEAKHHHHHLPYPLQLIIRGLWIDRLWFPLERSDIELLFLQIFGGQYQGEGKMVHLEIQDQGFIPVSTSLLAEKPWAYYLISLCPHNLIFNQATGKPALLSTQWVHDMCASTGKIVSSV